jgi:hypothetical protein
MRPLPVLALSDMTALTMLARRGKADIAAASAEG